MRTIVALFSLLTLPALAEECPKVPDRAVHQQPLECVWPLAKAGNVHAINTICYRFSYGIEGAAKDDGIALPWCEKGAALNIPSSITLLAEHYFMTGPKQDFQKSRILYERAALLGHPHAQFMAALMYSTAKGGDRNVELAQQYLGMAVAQGYEKAIKLQAEWGSR